MPLGQTTSIVAAIAFLAPLVACAPHRPSALTALQLSRDAAPLLRLCPTSQSIDQSQWPPSFASSGVRSVYIGHAGLYLETDRSQVQETGVFIPCDAATFIAAPGKDPDYVEVAKGVFTYHIAG